MLTFAGCGAETATDGRAGRGAGDYGPVTVENCGIEQTFERPPERAVSLVQRSTELLLALGLEDRMVGTAITNGPIREDLREAYESVPVLAEEEASREVVLGAEPDFVIGEHFSFADEWVTRSELGESGIPSYVMSGCASDGNPVTFDLLYEDITNVGRIFGVEGRARELIGEMKSTIAGVNRRVEGEEPVRVFVYHSGPDQPYTAGGWDMTSKVIELAGGRNIFEDVPKQFAPVSWEEVVEREPEFIVILDYGYTSAETKTDELLSNPALAPLEPIQEERFAVVGLHEVMAGARNGDAVEKLAESFHPEAFGDEAGEGE
jgi:iron complex transport system substrate-binding protein